MKTVRLKSDKIITDGKITGGYVYLTDGKISAITDKKLDADVCYDFSGRYLSAGFIDIHTHGAGGYAFMNSTPEDVAKGCDYHLSFGTTTILPTISAGSFDTMKEAVKNIAAVMDGKMTAANVIGAHLEGPYLSAAQCGAQCPVFITKPQKNDYESLTSEYGDYVARCRKSRWMLTPIFQNLD